jgi:hypothetical protein
MFRTIFLLNLARILSTMKKLAASLFLVLIALIISTCGRKVEKVSKEYLGTWIYTHPGGTTIEVITITDDKDSDMKTCDASNYGPACWYGTCYDCVSNGSGRTRIKGSSLHIGSTKFHIDKGPANGSSGKYMILDGKTYSSTTNASCHDGIMNQDETDIDCGGICNACPTCSDNIKNQDETNVDCGGTTCQSCFNTFTYTVSNPLGTGNSTYGAVTVDAGYHQAFTSNPGTFTLSVDMNSTNQSMVLIFDSYAATGTHSFNGSSYIHPGSSFNSYYKYSGSITITSCNSATKRISGTFTFTGYDPSATTPVNQYCYVTSGSFTNLKYHDE